MKQVPKISGRKKQRVTLGLSLHRPEMIPVMLEQMHNHDIIVLEEPPSPDFGAMLNGGMTIDDYLSTLDLEFPAFSHRMCGILRKLHREGKKIFQVEPFLKFLVDIHEFFSDGNEPDDISKNSIRYLVYVAERNATGALLSYYHTVMSGTFEQTVGAVKRFARKDAERFRLRDSLRAQALGSFIDNYPSVFIEAGLIHYQLWMQLRRQMKGSSRLKLVFLANGVLKRSGIKGHLYGPGDQLTLMNVFRPNLRETERETLLAARSLIYSKIITKNELTDNLNTLTHLRDELKCIDMVRRLNLEDCRRLFPLIRGAVTTQAYQIVSKYLADLKW